MGNQGALKDLDHDAALNEISSGVIARTIAQRHGVTADAVRKALRTANPEAYQQAVADQVEHWVFESADEMNELPADALFIARARARADFRLKLAAKLNPAYADKQQIEHTGTVAVEFSQRLRQAERVIEGECSAPLPSLPVTVDITPTTDTGEC